MASHYQTYVVNFNRVRLSELIDFHEQKSRISRAKPSLVVNPLTNRFYAQDLCEGTAETGQVPS